MRDMNYNFDQIINRKGTNCDKWDGMQAIYGRDDLLPLWIADMDFACPSFIMDALAERLQHPILGYTFPPDSCYEAIVEKAYRDYRWRLEKEWILFSNGVVDGLFYAVRGLTTPGSRVVVQEPSYFPFYSVIEANHCLAGLNTMVLSDNRYHLDMEDLENQLAASADALLFCNPHNPTGRVFTKAELLEVNRLCRQYHCPILADEIHCDVVLQGTHHPIASLNEDCGQNSITFWAASKTYNLPALRTAVVIIPNPTLRERYMAACMGQNGGNLAGYIALEQAWRHGGEYRIQLLEYLRGNLRYLKDYCRERLPQIHIVESEGTFLVFADFRELGLSQETLGQLLMERCGLALEDGLIFGPSGDGFWRINIACPRLRLTKALEQLENIVLNMTI